jgi:hypothetical protein
MSPGGANPGKSPDHHEQAESKWIDGVIDKVIAYFGFQLIVHSLLSVELAL